MAQLQKRLAEALVKEGVITEDEAPKAQNAIMANLPSPVYTNAVLFLGGATIILALGGILLACLSREVPEALWGALGAGIGGLAGIFMGPT